MREIKFRGKNEQGWHHGLLTYMFGSYAISHVEDENIVDLIEETTICQYIGKNDETDKEIYESDIVCVDIQSCPMGFYLETLYTGIVKYDTDKSCYYLDLIKKPENVGEKIQNEIDGISISVDDEWENELYFNEYILNDDITILGNIYENKELLEE